MLSGSSIPLRNSVLLLWCLLLPCGEARSGEADERQKLQGTWNFVKASDAANPKKEKRSAVQAVFNGDAIAFVSESTNRNVQGTYTVNTTTNPKIMDISLDSGGEK